MGDNNRAYSIEQTRGFRILVWVIVLAFFAGVGLIVGALAYKFAEWVW